MVSFYKKTIYGILAGCLIFFVFQTNVFPLTLAVDPDHISVHSLYHGSQIMIQGETDVDDDVVVKIISEPKKIELRRKGKAANFLWMNVSELEFQPVSDVYLIYATQEISELLSEQQQDEYEIGYTALKKHIEVEPVDSVEEKNRWIEELIKFKEKNNVYGVFNGKIETQIVGSSKKYHLVLDWPYEAPPQEYTVYVYSVKDKMVREYKQSPLIVEKVGVLRFLSNMAFEKAILYGIISIIIAITAGFIVSLIFKGSGGGH
jgi:hypothetical protein